MILDKYVWVFNGAKSRFSSGVFEELADAEKWINKNKLTGMLTKYPLNRSVFDWADENDLISMKAKTLAQKRNDPHFIGGFTSASMEHYHYEDGEK